MKLDTNSLAHTQWNRKYHIVFAPKYRRQIICGKIKLDIGVMLRKLSEYKGIEIIEADEYPAQKRTVPPLGMNKGSYGVIVSLLLSAR